ncbi:MAG: hypothetical protein KGI28_09685 [Thaumarchaeota archaeon]|nr:hypothetical protein [Nitrososphaerota archaeon]
MQKRNMIFASIMILSIIMIVLSVNNANADTLIPQWIRSNAKYWSEGNVTDAEYIQGIQYLISQGIIHLPVQEVTATNSGLNDQLSAKSFVVHFQTKNGNFDVYTISKLTQYGMLSVGSGSISTNIGAFSSPQFMLESIPSKDKSKYYSLISTFSNTAAGNNNIDFVDVAIDILAGDGSTIETLHYSKCQVMEYYVATNDNKQQYRFTSNDGPELRDDANFSCDGLQITDPSK